MHRVSSNEIVYIKVRIFRPHSRWCSEEASQQQPTNQATGKRVFPSLLSACALVAYLSGRRFASYSSSWFFCLSPPLTIRLAKRRICSQYTKDRNGDEPEVNTCDRETTMFRQWWQIDKANSFGWTLTVTHTFPVSLTRLPLTPFRKKDFLRKALGDGFGSCDGDHLGSKWAHDESLHRQIRSDPCGQRLFLTE